MAKHFYFSCIERNQNDYQRGTLTIDMMLNAKNICQFDIKGERPTEGQKIKITDDSTGTIFAGEIVGVQQVKFLKDKCINVWQIKCDDYTNQLDKKLVIEEYSNKAPCCIIKDIISKYCPEFTSKHVDIDYNPTYDQIIGTAEVETANLASSNTTIEYMQFDYMYPSECIKKVADYVGWEWYVDFEKDVNFFKPSELSQPAPMVLEPGGKFWGFQHKVNTQETRNRIYVRGGTELSPIFTYLTVANGVARTWPLPHKPHNLSLTVGGATVNVGIENIDDEATKDYMMNYEEKYVRCCQQTNTPVNGTELDFAYQYDKPIITMVEDKESQRAIAAIQGGDGIYEYIITDDSLTTVEAAKAVGQAELRNFSNPQVTGSFDTEVHGWEPGQIVNIQLADRGCTNQYLIQRVVITANGPDKYTYSVEFGGRLLGVADIIKSMATKQNNTNASQTATLYRYLEQIETVQVNDTLAINIENYTPSEVGTAEVGFSEVA